MKSLFAVILNLFQNPVVHKMQSCGWPLKRRPAGFQGDDNGDIFTFYGPQRAVGAGPSKTGFTLIELLVVVLIIGILASVALPQYQKAVLKSRTAEAWSNLKTINTAVAAYCLENPAARHEYMTNPSEILAIDVKDSKNFGYSGYIVCSQTDKQSEVEAHWRGGGSYDFNLGIHSTKGYRTCTGTSCKELGFTKYTSDYRNICVCGGQYAACYYAD